MDTHHLSDKDVYRLNLCRICLRVEFFSEICNPEGDNILPEVWQGRRPQDSSSVLWPNQARLFENSWSLWRSAIKLAYLSPEVLRATAARTILLGVEGTLRSMDRQTAQISTLIEILHLHRQPSSLPKAHCRISTS